MTVKCYLCGKFDPAGEAVTLGKKNRVDCERCGTFHLELPDVLNGADESILLRLSWFVRKATNEGRPVEITEDFDRLATSVEVPHTMGAYYDLLLQLLARRCRYPGAEAPKFHMAQLAAEAFLPRSACKAALEQIPDLVDIVDGFQQHELRCRLKPAGWRRVDELTKQGRLADSAFVAMWFHPDMDVPYRDGIHIALTDCGYEPPFRVDAPEHQERAGEADFKNRIDDRILAEIRRARFIVADATGARPSVYYEAGFADGLGIPVIWTCRADDESKMSFDTRQNEHILWKKHEDLRTQLAAKIARRGWKRG